MEDMLKRTGNTCYQRSSDSFRLGGQALNTASANWQNANFRGVRMTVKNGSTHCRECCCQHVYPVDENTNGSFSASCAVLRRIRLMGLPFF